MWCSSIQVGHKNLPGSNYSRTDLRHHRSIILSTLQVLASKVDVQKALGQIVIKIIIFISSYNTNMYKAFLGQLTNIKCCSNTLLQPVTASKQRQWHHRTKVNVQELILRRCLLAVTGCQ